MNDDAAAQSRGSSFYSAMRILPKPQRDAMFQIYSFCRAVDDIADEGGPRPARSKALEKWRADIDALYEGDAPAPHLYSLFQAIHTFHLRREDFLAVIDGMEMDVIEDIQAPDSDRLDLYCDRVASAVGRLSVCVFGVPEGEGEALAHHLGRAFQLTNILRDIDEDAAIDRLYLPREALKDAGITSTVPRDVMASPALGAACVPLLARATAHFAEGSKIMARCPRHSVRAPRIMAYVYESILVRLNARGFAPPRERVRAPRHRIFLALLLYGIV
jgi:phytoene synthase